MSTIDIAAQFGGEDAADAALPHFKCLKAAARKLFLDGFPFPKLVFILRVDGGVTCYGFSGADNLEVDKDGEYVSIDIGIRHADCSKIANVISEAISSSMNLILEAGRNKSWNIELGSLQQCLDQLKTQYESELRRVG